LIKFNKKGKLNNWIIYINIFKENIMSKKILTLSCFSIILVPCLALAEPVCNSIDQCLTLAKQKNVEAQYQLGQLYYEGKSGATKQYQNALTWFQKAANAGNDKAQYYLGLMYYSGEGVKTNYNKAVDWFTKSAKSNNDKAQYYLGLSYYYGRGVVKNLDTAKDWFIKAANNGYKKANDYLEKIKSNK
jgi:TPR repeat protein